LRLGGGADAQRFVDHQFQISASAPDAVPVLAAGGFGR